MVMKFDQLVNGAINVGFGAAAVAVEGGKKVLDDLNAKGEQVRKDADTQARVTSENFYWANRLIGALADVRFHECGRAVEDYQEKVGGMGHKQIHDVDAAVAALPEAEVPTELARANEAFAERVRVETDALLGKVLYTTSCAMKNSFAMNDNVR